jgi:hypothetical protein
VNDGGRWKFGTNGEPLPFENLRQYETRRIQDRFTLEMLAQYLGSFGIDYLSSEYYDIPQPAFLLTKEGPSAPGMMEYSLDEARADF